MYVLSVIIFLVIFLVRMFYKNRSSLQESETIKMNVTFTNKIVDVYGAYKADVIMEGVTLPQHSFFPAQWSREKVIRSIFEAVEEYKSRGISPARRCDGKYIIKGFSKEGMEIEIFITQDATITIAYPKLKR